jgi:hypothetical protein
VNDYELDHEHRIRVIELDKAKTDQQIVYVLDAISGLTHVVDNLANTTAKSQGGNRLLQIITPILMAIMFAFVGGLTNEYNKSIDKIWTAVDNNTQMINTANNSIIKLEVEHDKKNQQHTNQ